MQDIEATKLEAGSWKNGGQEQESPDMQVIYSTWSFVMTIHFQESFSRISWLGGDKSKDKGLGVEGILMYCLSWQLVPYICKPEINFLMGTNCLSLLIIFYT